MRRALLTLCLTAAVAVSSGCGTIFTEKRGTDVPQKLADLGPYRLGTGYDLMSKVITKGMGTMDLNLPDLKGKSAYIEIAEVASLRDEDLRNYIVSLVESKLATAGATVVPVKYTQTHTDKDGIRTLDVKCDPPDTDYKVIVHVHNSGVDHFEDSAQLLFLYKRVNERLTGTFACSVTLAGLKGGKGARLDSTPASEEYVIQNATKVLGFSGFPATLFSNTGDLYMISIDASEYRGFGK